MLLSGSESPGLWKLEAHIDGESAGEVDFVSALCLTNQCIRWDDFSLPNRALIGDHQVTKSHGKLANANKTTAQRTGAR